MRRRFTAVLISCAMLTVLTQDLLAYQIRQGRTWNELSHLIPGLNIRMSLPDGTTIRGQALEVRPDELVVDVRRTSNARLHGKGRTSIPRSDVSAIELFLKRLPGAHPNVGAIGAGLGAAAVSPLLFYLGETNKISGWAALAMVIGAAAGGAMVANHIHSHPGDVFITVLP